VNYHTVFDITTAGYKSWSFPAFGLIFVALSIGLVFWRRRIAGLWSRRPRDINVFAFGFLGFSVLWTATTFLTTYLDYARLRRAFEAGRFEVVEGVVTEFRPERSPGRGLERFCVQGRCFEYSDNVITAGFNNARSNGGPVRMGLPVRVSYVGDEILKLEIGPG